ncbi:MotE family protein [Falsiroseomonas sp.]|uniref:MotE family protein n=1 Tax=Falsiroseomonas sp. TaxID=2870721 RepID=UPI003561E2CE
MPRLRLLPLAIGAAALLVLAKAERLVSPLWAGGAEAQQAALPPARPLAAAAQTPQPASPAAAPAQAPQQPPAPAAQQPAPPPSEPPAAEAAAERAVLEALRARRVEIEAREQAAAQREVMLAATERRLAARVEELTALQRRLEALERERATREETGLRGLVKLYEGMRPRDAAVIFDELEMSVLVSIVDRMREAKAAPVMGAMRPERARLLTTELARLRAERVEQQRAAQSGAAQPGAATSGRQAARR